MPYRLAAGVVVVHRFADAYRILLLRAYRNWDFPKGLVESGESPLEAARREVAEESGIVDLRFCWGEDFRETPPYAQGKIARYYLAETPSDRVHLGINPTLGRPEHHAYRWVSPAEAVHLLAPRLHPILAWAVALVEG